MSENSQLIHIVVGNVSNKSHQNLPSAVYCGRSVWPEKISGISILHDISNPHRVDDPKYAGVRDATIADFDATFARALSQSTSPMARAFEKLLAFAKDTGNLSLLCHCAPQSCHLDVVATAISQKLAREGYSISLEERVSQRVDSAKQSLSVLFSASKVLSLEKGLILQSPGSNMFFSKAQALVNPVNCVGVMGAGVAQQFAKRYPQVLEPYRFACSEGLLAPGDVFTFEQKNGPTIFNVATKDHYKNLSSPQWVALCAVNLVRESERLGITSLSSPLIGAGLGGVPPLSAFQILRLAFENSSVSFELHVSSENHSLISRFLELENETKLSTSSSLQR